MSDDIWDQGEELTRDQEDALSEDGVMPQAPQAQSYTQVEKAPENPRYDWERGPKLPPEARPQVGALEAGIRGLGEGALFGFGDELYGAAKGMLPGKSVSEETAYQDYLNRLAAEQQPAPYYGGMIGGAVGISTVPGVAPARGASFGTRALHSAATGALTGLGQGQGMADRSSNAALGMATNVGLGLGGSIARKAVGVLDPSQLKEKAGEKAVEAIVGNKIAGMRDIFTGDYISKSTPHLLEKNAEIGTPIVTFGASPATISKRAEEASAIVGQQMGQVLQTFDYYLKPIFNRLGPSAPDELGRQVDVPGILAQAKDSIVDALQGLKRRFPAAEGPSGGSSKKYVDDLIQQVRSPETNSFSELAKIRNGVEYKKLLDPSDLTATKSGSRVKIASEIRQGVERAAPWLGEGLTPERQLAEQYTQLSNKYRAYQPAEVWAGEKALREHKNAPFGLTAVLGGTSTANAMMKGGGAVDAATAATKGAAVMAAIEALKKRGTASQAVALNKLGNLIDKNPVFWKTWGPTLMKASERGAPSLAATHYLLMQSNPDYRQIVEQEP